MIAAPFLRGFMYCCNRVAQQEASTHRISVEFCSRVRKSAWVSYRYSRFQWHVGVNVVWRSVCCGRTPCVFPLHIQDWLWIHCDPDQDKELAGTKGTPVQCNLKNVLMQYFPDVFLPSFRWSPVEQCAEAWLYVMYAHSLLIYGRQFSPKDMHSINITPKAF